MKMTRLIIATCLFMMSAAVVWAGSASKAKILLVKKDHPGGGADKMGDWGGKALKMKDKKTAPRDQSEAAQKKKERMKEWKRTRDMKKREWMDARDRGDENWKKLRDEYNARWKDERDAERKDWTLFRGKDDKDTAEDKDEK
jgi:hypothetical protein